MKLKNCSLRIEICSDWLYARILRATNRGINPLATDSQWNSQGSPVWAVALRALLSRAEAQRRRVFLAMALGSAAFGRDDLRVGRYRCGIRVWLLGGTTSVSSGTATGFASGIWEGRPPCRPVPLRHSRQALGRDYLRVVRYRYGSGLHD